MSDENVIDAKFMIDTAFTNIERAKIEESNNIIKFWRIVIESIKSNGKNGANLGKNLASHSRVIDLKNGILLVEADHPAWIQTLKIYQKYIITGLTRKIPDIEISSLAFRLKGTDFQLRTEKIEDETKKLNEKFEEKMNRDQKVFEKFRANKSENQEENAKPKEMPENLKKILDRLKNDMLTRN